MILVTISASKPLLYDLLAFPGISSQSYSHIELDSTQTQYQVGVETKQEVLDDLAIAYPPSQYQYYIEVCSTEQEYNAAWNTAASTPPPSSNPLDSLAFSA